MAESRARRVRVWIRQTTQVGDEEWKEMAEFGSRFVDGSFVDKLQNKRHEPHEPNPAASRGGGDA